MKQETINETQVIQLVGKTCKNHPVEILLFPDIDVDTDGVMIKCKKCKEVIFKAKLKEKISKIVEEIVK